MRCQLPHVLRSRPLQLHCLLPEWPGINLGVRMGLVVDAMVGACLGGLGHWQDSVGWPRKGVCVGVSALMKPCIPRQRMGRAYCPGKPAVYVCVIMVGDFGIFG